MLRELKWQIQFKFNLCGPEPLRESDTHDTHAQKILVFLSAVKKTEMSSEGMRPTAACKIKEVVC